MATNSQIQANLKFQIAKYSNNLNQLKTYPMITAGVAYNFSLR